MMQESSPAHGALVMIAAPPGTGKSTVLPHLVTRAHGRAVVADIDEALEDGALLGVRIAHPSAAPIWPAYDRLWERLTRIVTRSGTDMVLFTQVPDALPSPGAGTLLGWEIDDDLRAERLRGRGEAAETITDARCDARALRGLLPQSAILRTDGEQTPAQCAAELWRAIEPHLGAGAP